MESREETSIQQKPEISKQNVAYIQVPIFNHPTQRYAMFAFSAAIFVAVGGFLLGIGDTSYQIMTYGAFGCCGLVNLALILYAIYFTKLIDHNNTHNIDNSQAKAGLGLTIVLALATMVILIGNLFSSY